MSLKPYKSINEAIQPEIYNDKSPAGNSTQYTVKVSPIMISANMDALMDIVQNGFEGQSTIDDINDVMGGTSINRPQDLLIEYADDIIDKFTDENSEDPDADLAKLKSNREKLREILEFAFDKWIEDLERGVDGNNPQKRTITQFFDEQSDIEECRENASKDWNESDMQQYIQNDHPDMGVVSMIMEPGDGDSMVVKVKCNELSDEQKSQLVDWLEGQFSDGWGEGYEQQEQGRGGVEYYVHFWDGHNPKYKVEVV